MEARRGGEAGGGQDRVKHVRPVHPGLKRRSVFAVMLLLAAAGPVAKIGWLSAWSGTCEHAPRTPMFFIVVYASVGA